MVKVWVALIFFTSIFSLSYCTLTLVSKRSSIQACGSVLADILNLVCGGQFYSPGEDNSIERRQALQSKDGAYFGRFYGINALTTDGQINSPTLSRRQTCGVVSECCYNPCSLSVLASYCGK